MSTNDCNETPLLFIEFIEFFESYLSANPKVVEFTNESKATIINLLLNVTQHYSHKALLDSIKRILNYSQTFTHKATFDQIAKSLHNSSSLGKTILASEVYNIVSTAQLTFDILNKLSIKEIEYYLLMLCNKLPSKPIDSIIKSLVKPNQYILYKQTDDISFLLNDQKIDASTKFKLDGASYGGFKFPAIYYKAPKNRIMIHKTKDEFYMEKNIFLDYNIDVSDFKDDDFIIDCSYDDPNYIQINDILYLNGKELHNLNFEQRAKHVINIDNPAIKQITYDIAQTTKDFTEGIYWIKYPNQYCSGQKKNKINVCYPENILAITFIDCQDSLCVVESYSDTTKEVSFVEICSFSSPKKRQAKNDKYPTITASCELALDDDDKIIIPKLDVISYGYSKLGKVTKYSELREFLVGNVTSCDTPTKKQKLNNND